MNKKTDSSEALIQEQRELIKKLIGENQRQETMIKTLCERVHDLEERDLVIEKETTDISIDLDLVPEKYLN